MCSHGSHALDEAKGIIKMLGWKPQKQDRRGKKSTKKKLSIGWRYSPSIAPDPAPGDQKIDLLRPRPVSPVVMMSRRQKALGYWKYGGGGVETEEMTRGWSRVMCLEPVMDFGGGVVFLFLGGSVHLG